jgi:hypothetical protein
LSVCHLSMVTYVCLCARMPVYVYVCLPMCTYVCPCVQMSVYVYVCPSMCLSVFLSMCLSVFLSICLCVCLSICKNLQSKSNFISKHKCFIFSFNHKFFIKWHRYYKD